MILKWMPMACFGMAVYYFFIALFGAGRKEYPSAIYRLLAGCFFLLLILAMRALTD